MILQSPIHLYSNDVPPLMNVKGEVTEIKTVSSDGTSDTTDTAEQVTNLMLPTTTI